VKTVAGWYMLAAYYYTSNNDELSGGIKIDDFKRLNLQSTGFYDFISIWRTFYKLSTMK